MWASHSDSQTIPEAVNTCTFESQGGSAPKQARAQLVLSGMRGKVAGDMLGLGHSAM